MLWATVFDCMIYFKATTRNFLEELFDVECRPQVVKN